MNKHKQPNQINFNSYFLLFAVCSVCGCGLGDDGLLHLEMTLNEIIIYLYT